MKQSSFGNPNGGIGTKGWGAMGGLVLMFVAFLGCGGEGGQSLETRTRALGLTYYVAPDGDDGNPGSSEAPWATLQKAVDTLGAGDVVLVRPGTYVGFRIESSGTAGAVKEIRAADPENRPHVTSPGPENWHDSNIEVEGSESAFVSHWIIDGFEVSGAPSAGIDLRLTNNMVIRSCFTHDNGSGPSQNGTGIFTAFSSDILVEGNVSANNLEHGFYLSNSADRAHVRNNVASGNHNSGIQFNGDWYEAWPGTSTREGRMSDNIIENNVVHANGVSGAAGLNLDGIFDSVVRNNLLYDNLAGGISLHGYSTFGSSNNKVYNNTVIQPASARWAYNSVTDFDGDGMFTKEQTVPRDNLLANNILLHLGTRGSINVWGPDALAGSDHNVVVDRFGPDAHGEGNVLSLAEWQALTGFDTHSILSTAAALFENPAADDHRLSATSPAVDAGAHLGADVPADLTGVSRPQGSGYDIGAYERSGSGGGGGGGGTCVTGTTTGWANTEMPSQSGTFTATFRARVSDAPTNGVVGLSLGAPTGYGGFAVLVRFNDDTGALDVRNYDHYQADATIPYAAGADYTFRVVVDVPGKSYSVYVRPPGANEQTLAQGYTFRKEQVDVDVGRLDNWGTRIDNLEGTGTIAVCDFSLE